MKNSQWLLKVLKLIKRIYPAAVWQETNLYQLIRNAPLSESLTEDVKRYSTDLKKLRIDLYVPGQIAIEVHGEQHEHAVRFSNEILDPEEELVRRKHLDDIKDRALAEAGIPHLAIWWYELEDLDLEDLRKRIFQAQSVALHVPKQKLVRVKVPKFRTRQESFEDRFKRLEKARKLRREAYKKMKAKRQKNVHR